MYSPFLGKLGNKVILLRARGGFESVIILMFLLVFEWTYLF